MVDITTKKYPLGIQKKNWNKQFESKHITKTLSKTKLETTGQAKIWTEK